MFQGTNQKFLACSTILFLVVFFLFIVFSEREFGLSLQEFVSMNTLICLVKEIGYSCFACCYALFANYFLLACFWYLHRHIIACVVYDLAFVVWELFFMSLSFHLFMFSISCFKIIVSYVYYFFIYSCETNSCFGDCGTNNCFADQDLEKEVGFCWL